MPDHLDRLDGLISQVQGTLTAMQSLRREILAERDGPRQVKHLMVSSGRTPIPQLLIQRIADYLEVVGMATIEDITTACPDISFQTVRTEVLYHKYSLYNRKLVELEKVARKPKIKLVPGARAQIDDTQWVYRQEILEADPKMRPDDPLVTRLAECLEVYTTLVVWPNFGGKRMQANHVMKVLHHRGAVAAVQYMIERINPSGFDRRVRMGWGDATAEAICLDFPERFPEGLRNQAAKRFADIGQVPSLQAA